MSNYYITTTLPYVNASPHIGFGMELVTADFLARFHQIMGDHVLFNTGTDEHGQKIFDEATKAGLSPQAYTDQMVIAFQNLNQLLNISNTHFIRTTDTHHIQAAQEFWQRCHKNDDIYQAEYTTHYCVGCELEKQLGELVHGKCPLHPNRDLEQRTEKNYFFRLSKYQDQLLTMYNSQPDFVLPASKHKEISSFVAGGLQDFSISRLKSKMPWGIEVPDDAEHVMYVWFDALVNYISTLGWPDDVGKFNDFWPGVQIAGKDNLRQQATMWQAMLLSAGLPTSRQILINGFISVEGQKMSKSIGNVITPSDMVSRFGQEATRYLLFRLGPVGGDANVSWDQFDTTYTAELANGLGNLISRIAALCLKTQLPSASLPTQFSQEVQLAFANCQFDTLAQLYQTQITDLDQNLGTQKPWLLSGDQQTQLLLVIRSSLLQLIFDLQPILPLTTAQVLSYFSHPTPDRISPLFPRLEPVHG